MERYNIAPHDRPAQWFTDSEIIKAAENWDKHAFLYAGKNSNPVLCRIAAIVGGWVTAVLKNGSIVQAWAGDFTI